jgi:hypothetical protein
MRVSIFIEIKKVTLVLMLRCHAYSSLEFSERNIKILRGLGFHEFPYNFKVMFFAMLDWMMSLFL